MLIRVEGMNNTLRALRQMEPLTAREVGREVIASGRVIAAGASAPGVALRNWRTYSAASPRSGSRQASGGWPAYDIGKPSVRRRGMNAIVGHTSAAGAIYESAGRVTSGRDARGRSFIANLPPLTTMAGGKQGRYLRRSLANNYGKAVEGIEKAANKAADAVNRLMG